MVLHYQLFNILRLKIYNLLIYCTMYRISLIFQQLLISIYTIYSNERIYFFHVNQKIIKGI